MVRRFFVVFFALVLFISFASAAVNVTSPRDGTNYTSSSHVIFNASFINGTDFYFDGGVSIGNLNASFYSESAGTRNLLGNSSECAINTANQIASCWGNFSLSDGHYNISAQFYNATSDSINTSVNTSSIYFDSLPPMVFASNFFQPCFEGQLFWIFNN